MPIHNISGVPVMFPFEPYDVQTAYMSKVIESLNTSTNAVLESPTGTGKTLSLLCSTLGWLQYKKSQFQGEIKNQVAALEDFGKNPESLDSITNQKSQWGIPKIIYASRTHSQLSQAMQELKRSAYNTVKSVSIGSRDQLCIHPEVSKELGNGNKLAMCKVKVETKTCHFHTRVEKSKDHAEVRQENVTDIEDLVRIGQKLRCCPYFLSRELVQGADIIFMPYNYLLDPKTRKAHKIGLDNAIVILDEAHNVEKLCEESASIQVSSTDIALAIEDVSFIMKSLSEDLVVASTDPGEKDFTLDDLALLKDMMLNFEKAVDDIQLDFSKGEQTFDGGYIFTLLQQANINHGNSTNVSTLLDGLIQFLAGGGATNKMYGRKGIGLQKIADLVNIAFICQEQDYKTKLEKGYKVHVEREVPKDKKQFQQKKMNDSWLSSKAPVNNNAKIISYWCFNPGFGMMQLLGKNIRSIILTSGTLAPLKALISELAIPISQRLENPHIIGNSQVLVKVVSVGPDKEPLNSSYQNRDNPKYLSSLGRTILSFCSVVPSGMLVFFPSYPVMNKCVEHWQNTGLWHQMTSIKPAFVEPRTKEAFATVMQEYYEKINTPQGRGAIFMAVCRGKVSEGLDFADNNGRAVIITGLPFPPLKDPRVMLKQKYLDSNKNNENGMLSGQEWYALEATRAVNQAIGRVIRHKNDYGAILLCDNRFNQSQNKDRLSSWIQTHLKMVQSPTFGPIIGEVGRFFRNCERTLPTPNMRVPKINMSNLFDENGESSSVNNPDYRNQVAQAKKKTDGIQKRVGNIEKANELYSWKSSEFKTEEIKKLLKKDEPLDFMSGLDRETESINFNNMDSSLESSCSSTLSSALVTIHSLSGNNNLSKKRKYKLVANDDLGTTQIKEPPTPEKTSEPSNISKSINNQHIPDNRLDLLKMIKHILHREEYRKLLSLLSHYQRHDSIDELFNGIVLIFSNPSICYIIKGMKHFIKDSHKSSFDEKIANHFK